MDNDDEQHNPYIYIAGQEPIYIRLYTQSRDVDGLKNLFKAVAALITQVAIKAYNGELENPSCVVVERKCQCGVEEVLQAYNINREKQDTFLSLIQAENPEITLDVFHEQMGFTFADDCMQALINPEITNAYSPLIDYLRSRVN